MSEIEIKEVDPDKLVVSECNARKTNVKDGIESLKDSIDARGIDDEPYARPVDCESQDCGDADYAVYVGQRRMLAAQALDLDTIRVKVKDIDDGDARSASLADNNRDTQSDMSPIDRAIALEELKDENNYSKSELAEDQGVGTTTVKGWMEYVDDNWGNVFVHEENGISKPSSGRRFIDLPIGLVSNIRVQTGGGELGVKALEVSKKENLTRANVRTARDHTWDEVSFIDALKAVANGTVDQLPTEPDDEASDESAADKTDGDVTDTDADTERRASLQERAERAKNATQSVHTSDDSTTATDDAVATTQTADAPTTTESTSTTGAEPSGSDDDASGSDSDSLSAEAVSETGDTERQEETDESIDSVTTNPLEHTPTGVDDETVQEIKENVQQLESDMEELEEHPDTQHLQELVQNWVSFNHAIGYVDDLLCPSCGSDHSHLKWDCCDISFEEATVRSNEVIEEFRDAIDSRDERMAEVKNSEEDISGTEHW